MTVQTTSDRIADKRRIVMRKVIVSTYATLNGVIENPQDWSFDYFDEEAAQVCLVTSSLPPMPCCWGAKPTNRLPKRGRPRSDTFADRINSMEKYVVSTTLAEPLPWGPATLISQNVAEHVAKLKQQPGQDILIYGTGRLTHTLTSSTACWMSIVCGSCRWFGKTAVAYSKEWIRTNWNSSKPKHCPPVRSSCVTGQLNKPNQA
jgi:hypothetical protein